MARPGLAGKAGLGRARFGMAWQGRRGTARSGKAGFGTVRQGLERQAWRGQDRPGAAGQGKVKQGRHGIDGLGIFWTS